MGTCIQDTGNSGRDSNILRAILVFAFLAIVAAFSLLSCIPEPGLTWLSAHDRLYFRSADGSRGGNARVEINDSLSFSLLGEGKIVDYSTIEYSTTLELIIVGGDLYKRINIDPQNIRVWLDGDELHLERTRRIKKEDDRYSVMIDFRGFVQDSGVGYAPGVPHPRLNLKIDLSRVLWDGYSFIPIDTVFAYDQRSPDAPKR